MAYKLNIDFAGMCLFVPRTDGADRMHVVLPAMAGHSEGEHSTHRHIPLLVFDPAYLAVEDEEGNPLPEANTVPKGMLVSKLLLRDLVATIAVDGMEADICLCPDILDLKDVVGNKLISDVLTTDPGKRAVARVDLRAGRMTALNPGVCWEWIPGQAQRVAHRVRWTVDIAGDEPEPPLLLHLDGLHGTSGKDPLKFRPLGTGGSRAIQLTVLHSPPGDVPPDPGHPEKPPYNAPAPHFEGYYGLFENNVPVRVPLFRSVNGCTPKGTQSGGCDKCIVDAEMGGSPYTCMVTGLT